VRTYAQRIAGMIRTAEARGYNLYWDRPPHGPALRVVRARSRKQSGVIPRYFTQVYCLPEGRWVEIPEGCESHLSPR
jgi:hypothetical protein